MGKGWGHKLNPRLHPPFCSAHSLPLINKLPIMPCPAVGTPMHRGGSGPGSPCILRSNPPHTLSRSWSSYALWLLQSRQPLYLSRLHKRGAASLTPHANHIRHRCVLTSDLGPSSLRCGSQLSVCECGCVHSRTADAEQSEDIVFMVEQSTNLDQQGCGLIYFCGDL